jgi:hypothetical protein
MYLFDWLRQIDQYPRRYPRVPDWVRKFGKEVTSWRRYGWGQIFEIAGSCFGLLLILLYCLARLYLMVEVFCKSAVSAIRMLSDCSMVEVFPPCILKLDIK